tara:strand:+ start:1066 stop:1518 length:453 start_codon:yes stop_codon:yes gene_type:complete
MIEALKAKHFRIEEYVPEAVFRDRNEKAWQLIDIRLIQNMDSLKDQLEDIYDRKIPITINNWLWQGERQQSGLRITGQPYYRPYSQHTFGRAADSICEIEAKTIRQHIKDQLIVLPHACVIEERDSDGEEIEWLHLDTRNQGKHVYFMRA